MTELGWTNWLRFSIWLLVGAFIYFLYGFKNSRLGQLDRLGRLKELAALAQSPQVAQPAPADSQL